MTHSAWRVFGAQLISDLFGMYPEAAVRRWAKARGVSRETIREGARRAGIPRRQYSWQTCHQYDAVFARGRALYESGVGLTELTRQLGGSRGGWKYRLVGRKRRTT